MSDFNKGDFTQQGVDGHVRATLRLNEKRYVELDLTTNENARGCTISGNVHDRLNNLDYPIGAAPSGNIEITENTAEGEPLDISQYATATVNVAGGGGAEPIVTEIRNFVADNLAFVEADQQYEQVLTGIMVPLDTMGESPNTIIVTFDGTDYLCQFDNVNGCYGAPVDDHFTEIPFRIGVSYNVLECLTAGPHTFKISVITEPGTLTINTNVSNLLTDVIVNGTTLANKTGAGVINTLLIGGATRAMSYDSENHVFLYENCVGCVYDEDEGQLIITDTTASVTVTMQNNVNNV